MGRAGPIKLADPKELERKISLQSQMFSIYSEGVVKGLRRTTRVRIHAVIDRRTSRDLASSALGGMGGVGGVGGLGAVPGGGLPGAGLPGTSPNTASAAAIPTAGPLGGGMGTGIGLAAGLGASGSPQSLLQAVGADPAGSVVYYRIE